MPSKKVIRELVGKNWRTYLLCALKTTQIQGISANRTVQNPFKRVRVLLWIYPSVKSRVWPIGVPPMISYLGAIQKQSQRVHAISQMRNQNMTSQLYTNASTTWPTLSTYLKEPKMYLHRSGNIAMNLHGDTIKWTLHGLAAAPPTAAFKGLPISDCFQQKLEVPVQSASSHLQNSRSPTVQSTHWAVEISLSVHGNVQTCLHPLDCHHAKTHRN